MLAVQTSPHVFWVILACMPVLAGGQQSSAHEADAAAPLQASNPAPRPATPQGGHEPRATLGGKPVSTAQLQAAITDLAKKRDSAAARELSRLGLTERLSTARLRLLETELPGPRARDALVALADASAFLDPPDAEIPIAPTPDMAEQRRIVLLALDYLARTVPKLPNFFATRTTVRYDDTSEDPYRPGVILAGGEALHQTGSSSAIVVYRDHKEVVDTGATPGRKAHAEDAGLVTRGTFGPILSTVMLDAVHGQLRFSHWEKGSDGLEAVFGCVVGQGQSHYNVSYHRDAESDAKHSLEGPTAYHCEVALDPGSGAILRLTLQADPAAGDAVSRSDIMVEYGSVEIGGKSYICPLRSVALSQIHVKPNGGNSFGMVNGLGPAITRLNDVEFADYHMFRTEMRMLTGDEVPAEARP